MKQRLPQIVNLKNRGVVGETNAGYLGFVTAKKEKQDVVAAENQDRKAIYTKIAKQQNVSIQLVQKRAGRPIVRKRDKRPLLPE